MNSIAVCPHCYQPIKDFVFLPKTDPNGRQLGDEFTYQCPNCQAVVTDPWEIDVSQQVVWVDDRKDMPNVCVSCGMFTDRRVKVKATAQAYSDGNGSITTLPQLLGCLIGIFLGPLSALLTHWLFADDSKGELKDVKISAKIPQCIMCSGQRKAIALAATANPRRVLIPAHHAFVDKWTQVETASRNADLGTRD